MRILVIDDNMEFAGAVCDMLRPAGYDVALAYSEVEAKKVIAEAEPRFDVALVDMWLEDPESGVRIVEHLLAASPRTAPIVLTGYAGIGNAARCMEAGAFSYISKEHTPELLLQTIEHAVTHSRLAGSLPVLSAALKRIASGLDGVARSTTDLVARVHRLEDEIEATEQRMEELLPQSDPSVSGPSSEVGQDG